MSTLRLAIFDCDGTLVDSQRSIVRAMCAGFANEGLALPAREAILATVGLPLRQCVERLMPDAPSDQIDRVAQGYSDSYRLHRESGMDEPPLYPETRAMLETLHAQSIVLAVATGKSRRGLRHTLAVHDLAHLFAETRTADDGPGKPNPTILLDICDCVGIPPAESAIIGDTTYDIEMGVHARMTSVGVAWGYHDEPTLLRAGAVEVIDSWSQLAPYFGVAPRLGDDR